MRLLILLNLIFLVQQNVNAQIFPGFGTLKLYEIDFEGDTFTDFNDTFSIDTITGNLWQVGTTTKTFANNTDTIRGIMTDTLDEYSDSADDWFVVKINRGALSLEFFNPYIEIVHQYDTDSFFDGCIIEYSCDTMQSWHNIIEDSCYDPYYTLPHFLSQNLYDSAHKIVNEQYGFSGNSDGWKHTFVQFFYTYSHARGLTIAECYECLYQNYSYLRFRFVSDSNNTHKDGWIIKKLILHLDDYNAIENPQKYQILNVFPNPSPDGMFHFPEFKLFNKATVIHVFNILGEKVIEQSFSETLNISHLQNGMYYYRVQDEENAYSGKLIIGK